MLLEETPHFSRRVEVLDCLSEKPLRQFFTARPGMAAVADAELVGDLLLPQGDVDERVALVEEVVVAAVDVPAHRAELFGGHAVDEGEGAVAVSSLRDPAVRWMIEDRLEFLPGDVVRVRGSGVGSDCVISPRDPP